jgi:hypothetical protein
MPGHQTPVRKGVDVHAGETGFHIVYRPQQHVTPLPAKLYVESVLATGMTMCKLHHNCSHPDASQDNARGILTWELRYTIPKTLISPAEDLSLQTLCGRTSVGLHALSRTRGPLGHTRPALHNGATYHIHCDSSNIAVVENELKLKGNDPPPITRCQTHLVNIIIPSNNSLSPL